MTIRSVTVLVLILLLSTSAVGSAATAEGARQGAAESSAAPTGAADAQQGRGAGSEEYARLSRELQALRQALPGKRQELARLKHKWKVAKGRTPTEKELKEFEEKRAKGEATFQDNPYINKKPLSTPGPARLAYYKKLEEIEHDEERVSQLEQELGP